MNVSPLVLEAAPRSRVREWIQFANEQAMYDSYRAEEAIFRARAGRPN